MECDHLFEIFFTDTEDKVELVCPECKCESVKRVISKTNYTMGAGKGNSKKPKFTSKSCGSGNECMTMEIPGLGD